MTRARVAAFARRAIWRELSCALAVTLLALSQQGCMSMQPVVTTGAAVPLAIEAGDRIRVVDKQGVTTELVVTTVGSGLIEGTNDDGLVVRVAAADIEELEERRFAIGRTIALATGLGVFVVLGEIAEAINDFWGGT